MKFNFYCFVCIIGIVTCSPSFAEITDSQITTKEYSSEVKNTTQPTPSEASTLSSGNQQTIFGEISASNVINVTQTTKIPFETHSVEETSSPTSQYTSISTAKQNSIYSDSSTDRTKEFIPTTSGTTLTVNETTTISNDLATTAQNQTDGKTTRSTTYSNDVSTLFSDLNSKSTDPSLDGSDVLTIQPSHISDSDSTNLLGKSTPNYSAKTFNLSSMPIDSFTTEQESSEKITFPFQQNTAQAVKNTDTSVQPINSTTKQQGNDESSPLSNQMTTTNTINTDTSKQSSIPSDTISIVPDDLSSSQSKSKNEDMTMQSSPDTLPTTIIKLIESVTMNSTTTSQESMEDNPTSISPHPITTQYQQTDITAEQFYSTDSSTQAKDLHSTLQQDLTTAIKSDTPTSTIPILQPISDQSEITAHTLANTDNSSTFTTEHYSSTSKDSLNATISKITASEKSSTYITNTNEIQTSSEMPAATPAEISSTLTSNPPQTTSLRDKDSEPSIHSSTATHLVETSYSSTPMPLKSTASIQPNFKSMTDNNTATSSQQTATQLQNTGSNNSTAEPMHSFVSTNEISTSSRETLILTKESVENSSIQTSIHLPTSVTSSQSSLSGQTTDHSTVDIKPHSNEIVDSHASTTSSNIIESQTQSSSIRFQTSNTNTDHTSTYSTIRTTPVSTEQNSTSTLKDSSTVNKLTVRNADSSKQLISTEVQDTVTSQQSSLHSITSPASTSAFHSFSTKPSDSPVTAEQNTESASLPSSQDIETPTLLEFTSIRNSGNANTLPTFENDSNNATTNKNADIDYVSTSPKVISSDNTLVSYESTSKDNPDTFTSATSSVQPTVTNIQNTETTAQLKGDFSTLPPSTNTICYSVPISTDSSTLSTNNINEATSSITLVQPTVTQVQNFQSTNSISPSINTNEIHSSKDSSIQPVEISTKLTSTSFQPQNHSTVTNNHYSSVQTLTDSSIPLETNTNAEFIDITRSSMESTSNKIQTTISNATKTSTFTTGLHSTMPTATTTTTVKLETENTDFSEATTAQLQNTKTLQESSLYSNSSPAPITSISHNFPIPSHAPAIIKTSTETATLSSLENETPVSIKDTSSKDLEDSTILSTNDFISSTIVEDNNATVLAQVTNTEAILNYSETPPYTDNIFHSSLTTPNDIQNINSTSKLSVQSANTTDENVSNSPQTITDSDKTLYTKYISTSDDSSDASVTTITNGDVLSDTIKSLVQPTVSQVQHSESTNAYTNNLSTTTDELQTSSRENLQTTITKDEYSSTQASTLSSANQFGHSDSASAHSNMPSILTNVFYSSPSTIFKSSTSLIYGTDENNTTLTSTQPTTATFQNIESTNISPESNTSSFQHIPSENQFSNTDFSPSTYSSISLASTNPFESSSILNDITSTIETISGNTDSTLQSNTFTILTNEFKSMETFTTINSIVESSSEKTSVSPTRIEISETSFQLSNDSTVTDGLNSSKSFETITQMYEDASLNTTEASIQSSSKHTDPYTSFNNSSIMFNEEVSTLPTSKDPSIIVNLSTELDELSKQSTVQNTDTSKQSLLYSDISSATTFELHPSSPKSSDSTESITTNMESAQSLSIQEVESKTTQIKFTTNIFPDETFSSTTVKINTEISDDTLNLTDTLPILSSQIYKTDSLSTSNKFDNTDSSYSSQNIDVSHQYNTTSTPNISQSMTSELPSISSGTSYSNVNTNIETATSSLNQEIETQAFNTDSLSISSIKDSITDSMPVYSNISPDEVSVSLSSNPTSINSSDVIVSSSSVYSTSTESQTTVISESINLTEKTNAFNQYVSTSIYSSALFNTSGSLSNVEVSTRPISTQFENTIPSNSSSYVSSTSFSNIPFLSDEITLSNTNIDVISTSIPPATTTKLIQATYSNESSTLTDSIVPSYPISVKPASSIPHLNTSSNATNEFHSREAYTTLETSVESISGKVSIQPTVTQFQITSFNPNNYSTVTNMFESSEQKSIGSSKVLVPNTSTDVAELSNTTKASTQSYSTIQFKDSKSTPISESNTSPTETNELEQTPISATVTNSETSALASSLPYSTVLPTLTNSLYSSKETSVTSSETLLMKSEINGVYTTEAPSEIPYTASIPSSSQLSIFQSLTSESTSMSKEISTEESPSIQSTVTYVQNATTFLQPIDFNSSQTITNEVFPFSSSASVDAKINATVPSEVSSYTYSALTNEVITGKILTSTTNDSSSIESSTSPVRYQSMETIQPSNISSTLSNAFESTAREVPDTIKNTEISPTELPTQFYLTDSVSPSTYSNKSITTTGIIDLSAPTSRDLLTLYETANTKTSETLQSSITETDSVQLPNISSTLTNEFQSTSNKINTPSTKQLTEIQSTVASVQPIDLNTSQTMAYKFYSTISTIIDDTKIITINASSINPSSLQDQVTELIQPTTLPIVINPIHSSSEKAFGMNTTDSPTTAILSKSISKIFEGTSVVTDSSSVIQSATKTFTSFHSSPKYSSAISTFFVSSASSTIASQATSSKIIPSTRLATLSSTKTPTTIPVTRSLTTSPISGARGECFLKYGFNEGDNQGYFWDKNDGYFEVILPNQFIIGTVNYKKVFVNVNGFISFGNPVIAIQPYFSDPLQYISKTAVLAPFWADIDLNNNGFYNQGRIFYKCISRRTKYSYVPYYKDREVFDYVQRKVIEHIDNTSTFSPSMVCSFTWSNVSPYPFSNSNSQEIATFQLVLTNDNSNGRSFAIFSYEYFNWNGNRKNAQGYKMNDKDNIKYYLYTSQTRNFVELPFIPGPTGKPGQWFFKLSQAELKEESPAYKCFLWYDRQLQSNSLSNFWSLPECPCNLWQAMIDPNYGMFRYEYRSNLLCFIQHFPRFSTSTQKCCYHYTNFFWSWWWWWWRPWFFISSSWLDTSRTYDSGSVLRYHPYYYNQQYYLEDKLPKSWCCLESNNCDLFYEVRPKSYCWGYRLPFFGWMWGDPHINTLDGFSYTFNGWGEYWMIKSTILKVQARTSPYINSNGELGNATIFTGFAFKDLTENFTSPRICVVLDRDQKNMIIKGDDGDSNEITKWFYSSDSANGTKYSNITTATLIANDSSLIISFPSGVQATIDVVERALRLSMTVPDSAKDLVFKGLYGYFDGDVTNDLTFSNGTVISSNSSERQIFDFGQSWSLSRNVDSYFWYNTSNNESFESFQHPEYVPVFSDELDDSSCKVSKADAESSCQLNNKTDNSCLYDYCVTGDKRFAEATMLTAKNLDDTKNALKDNYVPLIIIPLDSQMFTVNITTNITISINGTGHDFQPLIAKIDSFEINITCLNSSCHHLVLEATPRTSDEFTLKLYGNDTNGKEANPVSLPILMCDCSGRGECQWNETISTNNTDFKRTECLCKIGIYSGDNCQNVINYCDGDPCSYNRSCTSLNESELNALIDSSDSSKPFKGYMCSNCPNGFTNDDMDRCIENVLLPINSTMLISPEKVTAIVFPIVFASLTCVSFTLIFGLDFLKGIFAANVV